MVVALLACGLLALGAAQAAASGVISSFTLTPASTQAGGDPNVTADLRFDYGASTTDSVRSVTIDLPPGLLASIANVPETCSADELGADLCPTDSEIGAGLVVTNGTTRSTGLYLMPPPAPGDAAGFGTVVLVSGTAYTGVGTLDVVTGAGGQPVGEVKLAVPAAPGEQVDELTATMYATIAGGKPFTRLPTSCATASSSASVETTEGNPGSAADSFVPTGCGALAYAPSLSSVQVIRDAADSGAELIASLSQPNAKAESATAALTLDWPSSLTPIAGPVGPCLTGTPCTIGTATATSPLAPASYLSGGTVTLGGTPQAPTLTVAFPPPLPLSIVGSIDVATGTISFPAAPDLPLSALTVDITGPPGARALSTTCAPGALAARFSPQSGGLSLTSSQPIVYRGCPPPKPPPSRPRPLKVSIRSGRLPVVHGRAKATLACSGGAAGSTCRGKLSLTVRERIVRRVHHRRTVTYRTIVLARAGYAVRSGHSGSVTLRLGAGALRLLGHSRHRSLRVQATATVHGGSAHRAIVLELRAARRAA